MIHVKISGILATTSLLSFVSSMQGLGLNNMATVQPDHDLTRKHVQVLHSTRVCFLRRAYAAPGNALGSGAMKTMISQTWVTSDGL